MPWKISNRSFVRCHPPRRRRRRGHDPIVWAGPCGGAMDIYGESIVKIAAQQSVVRKHICRNLYIGRGGICRKKTKRFRVPCRRRRDGIYIYIYTQW
jgi:hypothetical protein